MSTHEVFVRKSADPTFIRNMLMHWTDCISRYHDFHTPEIGHHDRDRVIWDSIMGQIERSQVSVLISASWLAGGVGMTEISTRVEGCRSTKKRKSKTRFGDFYLCSPGFVAFEGECKRADVANETDADKIRDIILSSLNCAESQHADLLHNKYDFSALYISFVQIADNNAAGASQKFENCLQIVRELARDGTDTVRQITAYAAQATPAAAPIEWDNGFFHPGSIVCFRECAPPIGAPKNQ